MTGKSAKPEPISSVSQENVDAGLHEDPQELTLQPGVSCLPHGCSVTCREAAAPAEGRLQPLPAKVGDVGTFPSAPLCLIA